MNIVNKHHRSCQKSPGNGADSDGIDRISYLPSEILCHILSLMPTKYAVATCILSTKWKNLFPLILNLKVRLEDTLLLHPETAPSTYLASFKNFVERLLNVTLRDVPSLQLFCLICQKFDEGREIAEWIRSALNLRFKRMDIRLCRLKNPNFVLDSLFGCNILSLSLLLDFADDVPECRFSMPNLEMLSVHYMKFEHVNALLASCPVLEYLLVNGCYCQPGEKLRISVPSLRALKIFSGVHSIEGEFELDTPKLEYISYDGFLASRFSATKMRSLRIARLVLDDTFTQYPFESDEKAVELVRNCADAEKYWMSEKMVAILQNYSNPLPRFCKMAFLSIEIDSNGWELIRRLFDCAPKLDKLTIRSGFDNESYEQFKASLKKSLSISMYWEDGTDAVLEIQRNAVGS